ncbi:hypothetical protein [Oerskovia flava]|uniref:hypothetical protein n=1 Tax=Oerskovia flava TaxID=2986422 RepID=UPI00223EF8EC|nr:hypothetical protein [Oerskovia sp. JB1-3-2]
MNTRERGALPTVVRQGAPHGSQDSLTTPELVRALSTVIERLDDGRRVGVAFSGDPASVLLLALTAETLGRARVTALVSAPAGSTAVQRCGVVRMAATVGAAVLEVDDGAVDEAVRRLDLATVVRPAGPADPGTGALDVVAPLVEIGLDRSTIVRLATDLGLALRAPTGCGEPSENGGTTEESVQVEAAESELRRLGLEELRVRHHGDLARLEAADLDLASVTSEPLRGEILRAVRSAGFRHVAIDLGASTDLLDG